MPDALAGLAASAALAVSDIPFNGPISEVRVARINGQFVINPTFEQLEQADMDLMVGATYENIMMVEGEMDEVSEQDLLEAMKAAHEAIKIQCKAQMELAEEVGSTVKREYCHEVNDEELRKAVHDACYDKAYAIAASGNKNKHERMDAFDAIREEFKAQFSEEELEEKAALIDRYYHDVEKEADAPFHSRNEPASALTDVRRPKSVLSGVRPATCPALTVPLSLHVANTVFVYCDFRHQVGREDYRRRIGTRKRTFPSALQLPSVLYGRSQGTARCRPS